MWLSIARAETMNGGLGWPKEVAGKTVTKRPKEQQKTMGKVGA